ncbi:hypothetical protein GIB67_027723 [Kingdonia uniflora]|uniref:Uncharacterized protein n=1 Tax=Kingdonia uniflora TaxID=39325 RepID=A0A7J7NL72_9MAGN|nr:hypothetical protein GIB67_027723 [Kingdonia uniflora]
MLTLSFDDLKLHQDDWGLKERYFANQNYMVQEGRYRYVYEAMLIETVSAQLEYHHINPKDLKNSIIDSKCYVTRVLHLSEWGLDPTKSRTLLENILGFSASIRILSKDPVSPLSSTIDVCKAITANGIWDFHLVDRIVCYKKILTDFVPTVGEVSLAEALPFMKAAGGAPVNVVVGISILGWERLAAEKAMAATAKNDKDVFMICVAYTSTDEIVHAVQESYNEKKDDIRHHEIDKELPIKLADLEKHMYMAVAPDLNILVRTSDCMVWAGLEYGYFQLYNYGCALVKSGACSISVELRRTKWVHCSAIRGGSAPEVEIGTALLNTSSKYGAIDASSKVFDKMLQESIVSRSAMIAAYGMYVSVQNALVLLTEMKLQVLMPNAVTILSVIQM